jgi:hypothetical protein
MLKRKLIIIFVLSGIILVSVYGIFKIARFLQIDSCLDKGGRWNYELKECEFDKINSFIPNTSFYWYIEYDTILNYEYLIRGIFIDSISQDPLKLIEVLNFREPKCKIEYIGIENDTLHIRILNDEILGEQMGSTGAYCYLGETVFTLTESDLVDYVRIDMNYGSHASPGIYQRKDFRDLGKR